jgi:hypothetical protein
MKTDSTRRIRIETELRRLEKRDSGLPSVERGAQPFG